MKVLTILGTARKNRSTDRATKLLERQSRNKNNLDLEIADLKELEIPIFQERRQETHPDPSVENLGRKIEESDVIVLVSPEYNHSFPGVLKNALDHYYTEYRGKVFGYVTTSAGGYGGIRQLSHLHDFTLAVKARPGPHMAISKIKEQITSEGEPKNKDIEVKADSFLNEIENFQQ